jgi:hypothetical protein
MVRAAFVGRQGPAFSAAVGALYAANMRMSTALKGAYRFACPPPSMPVLSGLYSSLNAGEIPPDLDPADAARIEFQMDYPDSAAKRFMPFGKAARSRGEPELLLRVVPLVETATGIGPGESGWASLVECQLLVLEGQVPSLSAPQGAAVEDKPLAAVVEAVRRGPSGKGLKAAVVWWLPREPDPTRDKDDKPTPAVPPVGEGAARSQLGSGLLSRHLPETGRALAAAGLSGPQHFFLWVRTEKKDGKLRVARRQLFDVGGVEIEYPYEEMSALIEHLGRLTA